MHKKKGTPKIGERWGPAPLEWGMADSPKSSPLLICVTISNGNSASECVHKKGNPTIGECWAQPFVVWAWMTP